MQPDRLFQAGFFAVLQVFLTATVIIVSRRAANGQLKRNQTTGIRTPSTMRSDQAWVAGHRAALRLAPLYLLQLAVMLTFLIIAALRTRSGIVVAGIGGTLLFLALVFFTAIIAGGAAKAVDDRDEDAAVQSPKARRGKAIHVYTILNGLLLAGTCVGLWLLAARANNNGVPPNKTLGFRDDRTFASEQGWYAAQRVGFHIGAATATTITVVVFAVLAIAYVRRFPPVWALTVTIVGELAIAVCLLIAAHYADKAATMATSNAARGCCVSGRAFSTSITPLNQLRYWPSVRG